MIDVDVRIIAATHQNLEEKVKLGEFREDLFYRLNVIPLVIPPLRDRIGDVATLADHFLTLCVEKLHKVISGFDRKTIELMNYYAWPGNVRELENAIEYAVNMTTNRWITIEDMPERIRQNQTLQQIEEDIIPIAMLEKLEIEKAVHKYGRSRKGIDDASKALGISRATIYRKLKE